VTKLSVNINKIATLRNARGGDVPNVVQFAIDCQRFGADGITVHPRPDERHITYQDTVNISKIINIEFNIEGYPDLRYFELLSKTLPTQATLVPDKPDVLTSSEGWNVIEQREFLSNCLTQIRKLGIRSSLFIEPNIEQIEWAAKVGADRIEFYTGPYAANYNKGENSIQSYIDACNIAIKCGLSINAGHDLSLDNLRFFSEKMPQLDEVSIGHALISDALYYGIENTIQMYKRCLS
jgi:pyridoxine 5-phosphate synthase